MVAKEIIEKCTVARVNGVRLVIAWQNGHQHAIIQDTIHSSTKSPLAVAPFTNIV